MYILINFKNLHSSSSLSVLLFTVLAPLANPVRDLLQPFRAASLMLVRDIGRIIVGYHPRTAVRSAAGATGGCTRIAEAVALVGFQDTEAVQDKEAVAFQDKFQDKEAVVQDEEVAFQEA